MKDYNKMDDKNLLEMKTEKEQYYKLLMVSEIIIGVIVTFFFLMAVIVGEYFDFSNNFIVIMFILAFLIFIIGMLFCLRIEQMAGYYECAKCHNRYVPTFMQVFSAMHFGRIRYMKCPECGKRSWSKKVMSK